MKFAKEFLVEEVLGSEMVVHTEIIEHTRWGTLDSMVFKFGGKLYEVSYRIGSGDDGERPFEYDSDEIECTEVEAVPKMVTVYEPVRR